MARKRAREESALHHFADELFRPTRLCVIAIALLGVISWPYVRSRVPRLADQPQYAITVDNIIITDPPEWVPKDIGHQIHNRASLPERMSLLDKGLVQQITDACEVHPWVKSVKRVEKQQPARVMVTLEYRKPVALVEVQGGLYAIDADGILLPPRDFRQSDLSQYPIVARVGSVPAGGAGESWGDPVVLGAARIAEILVGENNEGTEFWHALKVDRIETPNRIAASDSLEDLIYRLRTPGGSLIIWGRAPGTGHPGEVAAEKKIRRLEEYLADYGGYETAHGPSELDIRHWHEISHRALATQPGGDRSRR